VVEFVSLMVRVPFLNVVVFGIGFGGAVGGAIGGVGAIGDVFSGG